MLNRTLSRLRRIVLAYLVIVPPLAAAADGLGVERAAQFATLALAGIDREYPNKPGEVLTGPADLRTPSAMHPAFFSHYDWHSSVHAHWMLARLLRLYPGMVNAVQVRERLAAHLTAANVLVEASYFDSRENRSFERMYGWAWALRLVTELHGWDDPMARQWAAALVPLEQKLVALALDYLPRLDYPVRTGVHPDTAFALAQILDYARSVDNRELETLVMARARAYYLDDRDYPQAFEPSGQDFFSSGLNVADLMRRVLPAPEFSVWLNHYLPGLRRGRLGNWAVPAVISDVEDPQIVHLVGLNLSRAWTMQGIMAALGSGDRRARTLETAMHAHAEAGLLHVFSGHYEGEHWLASFAVYYLTETGLNGQLR